MFSGFLFVPENYTRYAGYILHQKKIEGEWVKYIPNFFFFSCMVSNFGDAMRLAA